MNDCQLGILVLLFTLVCVIWIAISSIVDKARLQEELRQLKERTGKEREPPYSGGTRKDGN